MIDNSSMNDIRAEMWALMKEASLFEVISRKSIAN